MNRLRPLPPPTPVARALLLLALLVAPAPPTHAADPAGTIALYRDDLPAPASAASPADLAELLARAGFATQFLDSAALASAEHLNRDRFDVLLLPYGASFPVAAADNFRRFLRAGGKFLSTGGYAFDALFAQTSDGWQPYEPPPPPRLDGVAWFHELPAAELRGRGRLTFQGFVKPEGVDGPGFAHFSVYQIAADGSLPAWRDVCQVRGTADWQACSFTFDLHPQAVTLSLRAGLYRCRGQAWFDDVRLTDAAGTLLLNSDFEQAPTATPGTARHWWKSHADACTWQDRFAHQGSGALSASLDFALPRIERLNTRHGRPEDGLEVEPSQLGVFQADYPLERAVRLQAAPGQSVLPSTLRREGLIQGWAASGVVGWNHARWLPLLNAYDPYGRLRGSVGALLRHYAGPWKGSSWAYFGVTNRNLFPAEDSGMADALVRTLVTLSQDVYFTAVSTDQACYQPGEAVTVTLPVFNGGRQARSLRAVVEIRPGEPPEEPLQPPNPPETPPRRSSPPQGSPTTAATLTLDVTVAPGSTNVVTARWEPPRFSADFYHLVATLFEGSQETDRIEGGFVVRNDRVIASGPRLRFQHNYLRYGRRPLFLFGTDDWSYVFSTQRETPLQWLKAMRQRRDLGVLIYENLQFGLPPSGAAAEPLWRKVDGVVQLAQKFDQVYFAGLLIGFNVAASDADLARQQDYCAAFARRYAHVPGLIHYLNGDYRCQLSEAVTPHWNQFLRERYGSDAALRQAWGPHAPYESLGSLPAIDYHDWEQTWADVSAYDQNAFRAWLVRRWNASLVGALRAHDPHHPTSGEFYQLPHGGVDLPAGIDGLDLANFGFFEQPGADLRKFAALCKFNDQRARGKSLGPGEYGVKTHPAWGDGRDYGYHTARTREQALELFLAIPHQALGLGASRIHNWCWKDDAHRVFPWGLVYPCDGVPKDTALVHRNLSLLFRHFAPIDAAPQAFVLTPDTHRLGGAKWKVIDGIVTSFDLALATHVANLGTLNETGLTIPKSARALFYPIPYCVPDATYTQLLSWVQQGGVLYLSGDLAYDEQRRLSRADRLLELCGVRRLATLHPPLSLSATNPAPQPAIAVDPVQATVLTQHPDGSPGLVENRVGRGRVFFSTDPLELHSTPDRRTSDVALYRRVLTAAGLNPLAVHPDSPDLHVFHVPLQGGGQVRIVCNREETSTARRVTLADLPQPITLEVAPRRPALLWYDANRALRAIESQGTCLVHGQPMVTDETQGVVLSLDGQSIPRSKALLLMPLTPGRVRWTSAVAWRKPVVETGDFAGGSWRSLETQPGQKTSQAFEVTVTADQAFSLLLVTESSALPRWRRYLERALTAPEDLP